ncbi:MAG: acyltransferase [Alteromonadaceae bacterium]|jgi:1-acyl-sn-glycerol-3-phosphate acyltransferase|tara:strand:- start:2062 stop:2964 length:903 start_codon:yes stop_codon:yes gene_type:complete
MLSFLPAIMIGLISFVFYAVNTIVWLLPIALFSLFKALIPFRLCQKVLSKLLDQMANNWVAVNTQIQKTFTKTKINVTGLDELSLAEWYLVISNHQTWVDILVLQRILHNKIPFLKFFLKKELIYVPFLGLAWWALDFPFMKRYSQAFLKKNPSLKGEDLKTTRKACAKFKYKPVSVMNFIEGTRFTDEKHNKQQSPYSQLLKPKAGGIAFVLDAMGEHLNKIVNVTIYYPEGIPSFSDFILGKVNQIEVNVETMVIKENLKGDYFNDRATKIHFQKWVNQIWRDKELKLVELQKKSSIS